MMDNSATVHICNNRSLFEGSLSPGCGVTTANGTPEHMQGNVCLKWNDDEGVECEYLLDEVQYVPESPVNLFLVRCFAKRWPDENGNPDDKGTRVSTRYAISEFTWEYGTKTRTFPNSTRGLPEMPMNEGYGNFRKYVNYFIRFVADKVESNFMSCYLNIVEDDESVSSTFDVNVSSNEEDHTISNEGYNIISNEGANKKTDCYVGSLI